MALTNTLAGRNLGMLLLGVYLILIGLLPLGISFPMEVTITALLAIAAGILILLER